MSDDDLRKWNVPRCAKEIRALLDRVQTLETRTNPDDPGTDRDVWNPPASRSPGNIQTFEAWCEHSILSLMMKEGYAVTNWDTVSDTIQNLAAAWAVVLAARDASHEELLAFFDHADRLHKKMNEWLEVKRRHVLSKSTISVDIDKIPSNITTSEPRPPAPGDRSAMPTRITPEELAREEAAYGAEV